jgi:hypothetical protein
MGAFIEELQALRRELAARPPPAAAPPAVPAAPAPPQPAPTRPARRDAPRGGAAGNADTSGAPPPSAAGRPPHAADAAELDGLRASAARAREGLSALLAQLDDGGVAPALPHIAVTEAGPLSLGVCAHHPHHPAVWLLLFGEGGALCPHKRLSRSET